MYIVKNIQLPDFPNIKKLCNGEDNQVYQGLLLSTNAFIS